MALSLRGGPYCHAAAHLHTRVAQKPRGLAQLVAGGVGNLRLRGGGQPLGSCRGGWLQLWSRAVWRGVEGNWVEGNGAAKAVLKGGEPSAAVEVKDLPTALPPPDTPVSAPSVEVPLWTDRIWCSPLDLKRRIFCNRSLNMRSIRAVGFDMDYTLAQYRPDTFETLAYQETVKKLVKNLGYPQEILSWEFDWRYMIRGLVLDKKRGNILKMDRHKYVKVAYHGFREMSREDRLSTYGNAPNRDTFDEPDYALIDTLFSLAEAYLFGQLVDFKDANPERMPPNKDYATLYKDVRAAVDLCHRDGSLKQAVANNPALYIYKDELVIGMLQMLRASGRRTFLVTNSLWDYTHVVMNYLFGKCGTDGGTPRDDKWLDYFDVVITGSAKPGFFMEGTKVPLFEVDPSTGLLRNTDNGSPMVQVGQPGPPTPPPPVDISKCRVFQGGSVNHLHSMLKTESGAQVLYVGDHIYGDILRSKKQLGWRTMLVVPELETELQVLQRTNHLRDEFQRLRYQRDALDDHLQRLEWALKFDTEASDVFGKERLAGQIGEVRSTRDRVRESHRATQRKLHNNFHSVWGQLMKTGYQNSRFAHQVERFACLYTSQVSNLCYYSPDKSYRTCEDSMPHEADISDG